jgi:hypothetical protein
MNHKKWREWRVLLYQPSTHARANALYGKSRHLRHYPEFLRLCLCAGIVRIAPVLLRRPAVFSGVNEMGSRHEAARF